MNAIELVTPRSEITFESMPAPQKMAQFAYAISAEVTNGEYDLGSGRFVLLHQPGGQEAWDGEFRCVTYLSVDLEETMQDDPLLPEVGWNWLLDSLRSNGANFSTESGTVTKAVSHSFGKLSTASDGGEIEIRASWTPIIDKPEDLLGHLEAWCNLLAEISYLMPVPDGVASFRR